MVDEHAPDPLAPSERPKRERSARYPGASLGEALEFAKAIDDHGLDGTSAEAIATSMGFESIKTRTFSSRLSAARQFGLLVLEGNVYRLTGLTKRILYPVDAGTLPSLYAEAFSSPALYSDLLERFQGRTLPPIESLANLLFHHHQITSSAKQGAAEAFVDSARFVGMLDQQGILRAAASTPVTILAADSQPKPPHDLPTEPQRTERASTTASESLTPIRIDLQLWGSDEGKVVRIRAPESMSTASFDRIVQALQLLVRIEP